MSTEASTSFVNTSPGEYSSTVLANVPRLAKVAFIVCEVDEGVTDLSRNSEFSVPTKMQLYLCDGTDVTMIFNIFVLFVNETLKNEKKSFSE